MATTADTGRTLGDGRYRIERLLGRGAMGTVWLAHDERLDRPVAIKEMDDPLAGDPRSVVRFRREAQVAGSLSHPNLVRVFDCALDRDRPFLVMEHVDGGTLAERLRDGRGPGDCRGLARQLLDALAHVHGAGLVHRNLHPGNILVGGDGRPRITGFGTVLPADAAGRASRDGAPIGPARYTAPEVLDGQGALPAADLFALGTLLAECTGGDGPAALERLIERLTAEDPGARPISAAVALEELDAAMPAPASAAALRRAAPVAPSRDAPAARPRAAPVAPSRDAPAARPHAATPPQGTPAPRHATTTGERAATLASHPLRPRRLAVGALAATLAIALVAVLTALGREAPPGAPPARSAAEAGPGARSEGGAGRGERGGGVGGSLDRLERIVRDARRTP